MVEVSAVGSKENNYIERYWRDATLEDAIREPPMVARFRDRDTDEWLNNFVCGVDTEKKYWFSKRNGMPRTFWWKCQVYDAPDPGEGWRLIDVEKDRPCENDEIWSGYKWTPIEYFSSFCLPNHYRRRIEQPKPEPQYVPFEWEDREQLRGRWITWKHENGLMIESQINHINQHRDGGVWFKSHDAKWLLENATFLDTGEPVGKRVQ